MSKTFELIEQNEGSIRVRGVETKTVVEETTVDRITQRMESIRGEMKKLGNMHDALRDELNSINTIEGVDITARIPEAVLDAGITNPRIPI